MSINTSHVYARARQNARLFAPEFSSLLRTCILVYDVLTLKPRFATTFEVIPGRTRLCNVFAIYTGGRVYSYGGVLVSRETKNQLYHPRVKAKIGFPVVVVQKKTNFEAGVYIKRKGISCGSTQL